MRAVHNEREVERGPSLIGARRALRWSTTRMQSLGIFLDPGQSIGFGTDAKAVEGLTEATSLSDYDALHVTVPLPRIAHCFEDDSVFAWQRLAGANPLVLRATDRAELTSWGMDAARYERAVAKHYAGLAIASFDAVLAEGRAFVADYSVFGGTPSGAWLGTDKQLGPTPEISAPVALFVWFPDIGHKPARLMPICIRCGPGPDQIYSPDDGVRWHMAKTLVQVADLNWQQSMVHLGRCHLILEAVAIAAERQLDASHPLHLLLEPHYEFTIAINNHARHNLISPAGQVDRYLAATLDGFLSIVGQALAAFRLADAGVLADIEERGVQDRERLGAYAYRDDAVPVEQAIRRFVSAYVDLYYGSDADVVADPELQGFVRDLGSAEGARLLGLPDTLQDKATLSRLLANMITHATVVHSAVNYPQYDFMGYVPNQPAAAYGRGPEAEVELPDDSTALASPALLQMLPPRWQALGQVSLLYLLSNVQANRLGYYRLGHFRDPRVRALVRTFLDDLTAAETDSQGRDKSRPMSYPYLFPSRIANSIHI